MREKKNINDRHRKQGKKIQSRWVPLVGNIFIESTNSNREASEAVLADSKKASRVEPKEGRK